MSVGWMSLIPLFFPSSRVRDIATRTTSAREWASTGPQLAHSSAYMAAMASTTTGLLWKYNRWSAAWMGEHCQSKYALEMPSPLPMVNQYSWIQQAILYL